MHYIFFVGRIKFHQTYHRPKYNMEIRTHFHSFYWWVAVVLSSSINRVLDIYLPKIQKQFDKWSLSLQWMEMAIILWSFVPGWSPSSRSGHCVWEAVCSHLDVLTAPPQNTKQQTIWLWTNPPSILSQSKPFCCSKWLVSSAHWSSGKLTDIPRNLLEMLTHRLHHRLERWNLSIYTHRYSANSDDNSSEKVITCKGATTSSFYLLCYSLFILLLTCISSFLFQPFLPLLSFHHSLSVSSFSQIRGNYRLKLVTALLSNWRSWLIWCRYSPDN